MHCGHARGFRSDRPRDWGMGLETPSARQWRRHPEGSLPGLPPTEHPLQPAGGPRRHILRAVGFTIGVKPIAESDAWLQRRTQRTRRGRTLTDALPSSSQLPGLSFELSSPGRWTDRAASVRSVTISFVCEDMDERFVGCDCVTFRDFKESLCNVLSRQPHLPTMTAPSRSPN